MAVVARKKQLVHFLNIARYCYFKSIFNLYFILSEVPSIDFLLL